MELIPLQAAQVPTPSWENAVWLLIGLLLGLPVPYWFAAERVRGLTRAMLSKMPYRPPPGMDKEEAMTETSSIHQDKEE